MFKNSFFATLILLLPLLILSPTEVAPNQTATRIYLNCLRGDDGLITLRVNGASVVWVEWLFVKDNITRVKTGTWTTTSAQNVSSWFINDGTSYLKSVRWLSTAGGYVTFVSCV